MAGCGNRFTALQFSWMNGYAYLERKEKLKAKIPELDIAYRSLIGDREEQQDCFGVFQNEKGTFAIVCDGMGGMEAGSLASRVAVQIFAREITAFIGKGRKKMSGPERRQFLFISERKNFTGVLWETAGFIFAGKTGWYRRPEIITMI